MALPTALFLLHAVVGANADGCTVYEKYVYCNPAMERLPYINVTDRAKTHLYVTGNQKLTRLESDRLVSVNLTTVFLDRNRISLVDRSAFRHLCRTTRLSLRHNSLTVVDPVVFAPMSALKRLDLSHNPVHTVAATFGDMPALIRLDLSDTRLADLGFLASLVSAKGETAAGLTVNASNIRQPLSIGEDTVAAGVRMRSLLMVNNTRSLCNCNATGSWIACRLDTTATWSAFLHDCYPASGGGEAAVTAARLPADENYVSKSVDNDDEGVVEDYDEDFVDSDDYDYDVASSGGGGGGGVVEEDDDSVSRTKIDGTKEEDGIVNIVRRLPLPLLLTILLLMVVSMTLYATAVIYLYAFCCRLFCCRRGGGEDVYVSPEEVVCELSESNQSGYARLPCDYRRQRRGGTTSSYADLLVEDVRYYPDPVLPTFADYERRHELYATPKTPARPLLGQHPSPLYVNRPLPLLPTAEDPAYVDMKRETDITR